MQTTANEGTGSNVTGVQEGDQTTSGKDDKKLTPGEIKKLKEAGYDPEELKGGKRTGQRDLFKDKKGEIKVKPKDGSGPGEPLGIYINNL